MRICFVSRRFPPAISGMSTYAVNIVRALARASHDVVVLSQYRGDTSDNVYRDGPPTYLPEALVVGMQQFGEQRNGDFEEDIDRLVGMIVQLHRSHHFDALHAQYAYPPGLAVIKAGRVLNLPTVVSVQGGDGHWFGSCCRYHRAVMRTVLRQAGEIVVGSESFGAEVSQNNRIRRKLRVVPGATDARHFRPFGLRERLRLRRELGIPSSAQVILYHGRIDYRKGLLDLINAFARTNKLTKSAWLVLSGVGPDEARIGRLITKHHLANRTRTLGYIPYEKAPQVYALADAYCIPTYGEGFSNTIVEAMASGLPVVSTKAVGVQDVFSDCPAIRLVEMHDYVGLADTLMGLLDDSKLRLQMGKAGRQLILDKYDWTSVVAEYVRIYKRLVASQLQQVNWRLPPVNEHCRYREKPQLL